MGTLLIIILLALIAVTWLIYEPISGIMGTTFIAKVVAVILAFKFLSAVCGFLFGSGKYTVRF